MDLDEPDELDFRLKDLFNLTTKKLKSEMLFLGFLLRVYLFLFHKLIFQIKFFILKYYLKHLATLLYHYLNNI